MKGRVVPRTLNVAFAWCAVGIVALVGCGSSSTEVQRSSSATNVTCSGPAPSYRTEVAPLFKQYCVKCHSPDGSAGDEHDFTRLEVLNAQRRRVKAVLEGSAMPPRGLPQPADSERALMIRWACSGG